MRHVHPLLGTNTVPELLRILALHEQRHQAQILDLLRSMPALPETGRPWRGIPLGWAAPCAPQSWGGLPTVPRANAGEVRGDPESPAPDSGIWTTRKAQP
jgi:hypothetical protein